MKIFNRLKELVSRIDKTENLDNSFTFLYSLDKTEKRRQIWDNLQTGLLLEDKNIFIPWQTPFNKLDNYKEKRIDSGDRTEWYFGKRKILNGYESHIESMMWSWLPWTNPVSTISENIGIDSEGNERFNFLKEYLTELLGQPDKIDLEKWGSLDLGEISWTNRNAKISLIGIEHFNARYSMTIGLLRTENEDDLLKIVEEAKQKSK